jgi:hypothetical protein
LLEREASSDAWASRYEDLRRRVTDGGNSLPRGAEVTVFIRQGILAWMRTWREEAPCAMPLSAALDSMRLPAGLYAEITQLLVNMLFHNRQEVLV